MTWPHSGHRLSTVFGLTISLLRQMRVEEVLVPPLQLLDTVHEGNADEPNLGLVHPAADPADDPLLRELEEGYVYGVL